MISEAERLSRKAIKSLYEGRPLTAQEKAALWMIVREGELEIKIADFCLEEMKDEN